MRTVLGLVSMLAAGWLLAVMLAVLGNGSDTTSFAASYGWPELGALDMPSMVVGMSLGVLIATFGRIRWGDLPRRLASWLLANERRLRRGFWAVLFLGVLLFY